MGRGLVNGNLFIHVIHIMYVEILPEQPKNGAPGNFCGLEPREVEGLAKLQYII